jgi:hypothetical protein
MDFCQGQEDGNDPCLKVRVVRATVTYFMHILLLHGQISFSMWDYLRIMILDEQYAR